MATCQNTVCVFFQITSNICTQDQRRTDWVVDKGNIFNTNTSAGEVALTLTQTNGGTRLSSTRYVHYGTITANRNLLHSL